MDTTCTGHCIYLFQGASRHKIWWAGSRWLYFKTIEFWKFCGHYRKPGVPLVIISLFSNSECYRKL